MGTRIRQLRIARGLTQQEVAKYCGVSRPAVTQWENGMTANVKLEAFLKLTECLHTDFAFLIYGPDRGRASRERKPGTGS
jgi:transcriptional regulator with XRE-family HTH domain